MSVGATAGAAYAEARAISDSDVVGFTFRERGTKSATLGSHHVQRQTSSHIMVQIDCDGNIEWLIDTVHDVLGFHPAELVGTKIEELLNPDLEFDRAQLRETLMAVDSSTFRVELRHREGHYQSFSVASRRLLDAKGRSAGVMIGLYPVDEEAASKEAVRRIEERYRFLTTFGTDVVWGERAGVVDWVSPTVENLLQWRSSDLIGRSVVELVHSDDRASLENLYRVVEGLGPSVLTLRIRKANGDYRWVSIQTHAAVESDSRVNVRVSSMRDAEDEVVARQALLASERRYRLLAENATDVVIEYDENGVIGWVSPSAHTVLRWKNGGTLGTRLVDHVVAADRERYVKHQSEADSRQRAAGLAIRYSTTDLEFKWMSQDIRRYRGNEAKQSVYVVTLRDIDENVSLRSALHDSQVHFELLAANASDVVYVVDRDGKLQWVSPSVVSELGWPVGNIMGHDILDLIFEEDHPRVIAWRQLLHLGETLDSLTIRVRHASGHFVWVKVRARAMRDDDGRVTGVVVSLRNFDAEVSNLYALRTISAVGRILVREREPLRMLRQICQVAVEDGGYALSFFARRIYDEGKSMEIVASSAGHESYIESITFSWGTHEEGQGPAGRAIRLGQTSTIADADLDPTFLPWRDNAHAHGFRSVAAIPIVVNAEIQGTWQLYAPEYGAFVPEVLSVLETLAIDIGYALARADSDWSASR